jgi:hypothetical protein
MKRRSSVKAKIRIHPLESLAAFLGILAVIGLGSTLLGGCTSDGGGNSTPGVDEKALKAKYEAEAEKQIDEKNADAVLGDLEKEIESDAAEE